ncbi:MAG: aldehyde:ferredoxin oxidoreductase [Dehalococcoidia bacterium]|nr:aldehyde:ferredoxin oxidoreductase [Dehalococcoidia bacterium]
MSNRLFGYHGRIVVVDLTRQAWRLEPLRSDVLRSVMGGTGLAARLLLDLTPPHADPLGPDNALLFVGSSLVGTPLTTTSKFTVAARSPLTGFIGDSLSSSHLALELKRSGLDAVVLLGASERWLTVAVSWLGPPEAEPTVRFLDATELLGCDTTSTASAVRAQLGRHWRVATIGPAGEALVRYATISNDGRHAGRTGTGAVMGSKRLKALALLGGWSMAVAHPDELMVTANRLRECSLGPDTAKYREVGTVGNLLTFDRLGTLPARNFQQATFDGAERLSGERLHTDRRVRRTACANCTIGCEQLFSTSDEEQTRRLEYETLFALGPLLGVDDPDFVLSLAARCDDLGLDTISTGGTIAWAVEGAERGVLDRDTLDGMELNFGNKKAIATLVERIGRREGVGHLLGEGSRRAADRLGLGSDTWAMHVKGLELPGYEPRSLKTMALGLAIGSRGACHNRVPTYEADLSTRVDRLSTDDSRGQLAAEAEDREAVMDSLILCKFVRKCLDNSLADAAQFWRLVTGWDVDAAEVGTVGARISTLKKVYNEREGWRREDDTLPPRLLTEPLSDGPASGTALTQEELDAMIASYYAARGWTADGRVPARLRQELCV